MSLNRFLAGALVSCAVFCTSCAELTHLTRSRTDFNASRVTTMVDAKQRAITAIEVTHGDDSKQIISCAEPSPDALSAISASGGFNFGNDEAEAALNAAFAESAGSIGLRTQSIQLLRDGMYRLCEGAQAGLINEITFEALSRRYQTSMVAILAIEQLTGAVRAPNVVLTGDAAAGSAELAAKYTDKKIAQRTKIAAAETKLESAEAALKAAETERAEKAKELLTKAKVANGDENKLSKPDQNTLEKLDEKVAEKKKARNEARSDLTAQKQVLEEFEKIRLAALSGGASATTRAEIETIDPERTKAIGKIARRVEKIVNKSFQQNALVDLCPSFLAALSLNAAKATYIGDDGLTHENPLLALCSEAVEAQKILLSP